MTDFVLREAGKRRLHLIIAFLDFWSYTGGAPQINSWHGGPNDDHIKASHGTYNLTAETGRFYDVTATTGLRFQGKAVVLTSASLSSRRWLQVYAAWNSRRREKRFFNSAAKPL